MTTSLRDARVLLIGAGGLGCPAARVLARSGVGQIDLIDSDSIELSNLQRQTLYQFGDVGRSKSEVAPGRLRFEARAVGGDLVSVAREIQVVPNNAAQVVTGYHAVIEGTDSFATKFLVADACGLAGVPVIQAGAVRWVGWALGTIPGQTACLRCVFEGIPTTEDTCAAAGVIGPVVGVLGAVEAAIALRILSGDPSAAGVLWSYQALGGALRPRSVERRADCALCSGRIASIDVALYQPPERAA